ncbi:MAG: hypothetical protein ACLUGF_10740 [Clostridium sp.]
MSANLIGIICGESGNGRKVISDGGAVKNKTIIVQRNHYRRVAGL